MNAQTIEAQELVKQIQFTGDGLGIEGAWEALEELKKIVELPVVDKGTFDNYGQLQPYTTYRLPNGELVQQIEATWSQGGFLRMTW